MTENTQTLRTPRQVSEREIAISLVIALAESGLPSFSLAGYYEDDEDFLHELAGRLNVEKEKPFVNKLRKVTRKLVNADVLIAERPPMIVGTPVSRAVRWSIGLGRARPRS